MTQSEFNDVAASLTDLAMSIVANKRKEYTEGNQDVLHNFKQAAAEAGVDPLQVWYIYFRKHLASIAYHIQNPNGTKAEPLEGRFADLMNYLPLGLALFIEREANQPV